GPPVPWILTAGGDAGTSGPTHWPNALALMHWPDALANMLWPTCTGPHGTGPHGTGRASGMPSAESERDLRSFGRRRGRRLSARQAGLLERALPRLAIPLSQSSPLQLDCLFTPPVTQVWLEIGFGGAEHLIWQARANPHIGLIGCEPFADGIV